VNVDVIYLILLILAAVCFALAAFSAAVTRVNLVAAGLFCWVLVPLIQHIQTFD
jgi:multisubunit Na+/H+ antiporter MnhG subunit